VHDHFHLQDAPWLQKSARARIVIWKTVADSVMEAPLLGVGARTGYVLNEQDVEEDDIPKVPRHAHNMFLQTWYELGAIGAAILLIAGLLCVRAISALPATVYPFALATFAVGAVQFATSWEIWQRWFFTLYILVWFCLALAIRSSKEKSKAPAL
jgi:O-antigen ligase